MNTAYVVRIARLDLSLLWRNRTALFGVIGLPLFFSGILFSAGDGTMTSAIAAPL